MFRSEEHCISNNNINPAKYNLPLLFGNNYFSHIKFSKNKTQVEKKPKRRQIGKHLSWKNKEQDSEEELIKSDQEKKKKNFRQNPAATFKICKNLKSHFNSGVHVCAI